MLEKPPLNHFPLIPVILSEFKLNLLLRSKTFMGAGIGGGGVGIGRKREKGVKGIKNE